MRMSIISAAMFVFCVNLVVAHADSRNNRSNDVQLLQAWVVQWPMLNLDFHRCRGPRPSRPGERATLDCTDQAPDGRPAAAPWNVTVQYQRENNLYSTDATGNMIEIRVVVRRSILESPAFQGIGFYSKSLT